MSPDERHPLPPREITEEQVDLASAAFLMAHEGCGDAVEFAWLAGTLVCYCGRCDELRTYMIVDQAP